MKHKLTYLTLIIILASFTLALDNGDFETGNFSGWQNGTGWSIGTVEPFNGSYHAILQGASLELYMDGAYIDSYSPSGSYAIFSYDISSYANNSNVTAVLTITDYNLNQTLDLSGTSSPIYMKIFAKNNGTGALYIDNIKIEGTNCAGYGDVSSCDGQMECIWNSNISTCEDTSTFCESQTIDHDCFNNDKCGWDFSNSTCFSAVDSCKTYINSTDCDSNDVCAWEGSVCQPKDKYCKQWITEPTCDTDDKCGWDPQNWECWGRKEMPDCGYFPSIGECNDFDFCVWNSTDCANSSTMCPTFITEPTCQNENCIWDSDCQDFDGFCSSKITDATCNTESICYWDGSNCTYDHYGGACFDEHDETACNTLDWCYWDGFNCFDAGSMCDSYSTLPGCDAVSGCYWNGTMCLDDYGFCNEFNTSTSCNNEMDCEWNGTTCIDIANYCDMLITQPSCDADSECHWNGFWCMFNDVFNTIITNPSFETGSFTGWQSTNWSITNNNMFGMYGATSRAQNYSIRINGIEVANYVPENYWLERSYSLNSYSAQKINITISAKETIVAVLEYNLSQNNIFIDDEIPEPMLMWFDSKNLTNIFLDGFKVRGEQAGAGCYDIFDSANCNDEPGCVWNSDHCKNQIEYCTTHITQPTCETDPECVWDGQNCSADISTGGAITVNGHVNSSGNVAYAEVCLWADRHDICTGTDANGDFEFTNVVPANYEFFVNGKWATPKTGGILLGGFYDGISIESNISLNVTVKDFSVEILDLSNYYLEPDNNVTVSVKATNNEADNFTNWYLQVVLVREWCTWDGTNEICYEVEVANYDSEIDLEAGTSKTFSRSIYIPATVPSGQVHLQARFAKPGAIVETSNGRKEALHASIDDWFMYINSPIDCTFYTSEYECHQYPRCVWGGTYCSEENIGSGSLYVDGYLKDTQGNTITNDNAEICMGRGDNEKKCTTWNEQDATYNQSTGYFKFDEIPMGTYGMYVGVFNEVTQTNSFLELFNDEDFFEVFKIVHSNITLYNDTVMDVSIPGKEFRDFGFSSGFEEQKFEDTTNLTEFINASDVGKIRHNIGSAFKVQPGEFLNINITVTNNNKFNMTNYTAFASIEGGWVTQTPFWTQNSTTISINASDTKSTIVKIQIPNNMVQGDAQLVVGVKKRDKFITLTRDKTKKATSGVDKLFYLDIGSEEPEIIVNSPNFGPLSTPTPTLNLSITNYSTMTFIGYSVDCHRFEPGCIVNSLPLQNEQTTTISALSIGHHEIYIFVEDILGGVSEDYRDIFYIDSLNPDIDVYYPQDNDTIPEGDNIEFEIDPKGRLTDVKIRVNANAWNVLPRHPFHMIDTGDIGLTAGNSYLITIYTKNEFNEENTTFFTLHVQNNTDDTFMKEKAEDRFLTATNLFDEKIIRIDAKTDFGIVEEDMYDALGAKDNLELKKARLVELRTLATTANASTIRDYFKEMEEIKNQSVGEVDIVGNITIIPVDMTELEEDYYLDMLTNGTYSLGFNRNETDTLLDNYTLNEVLTPMTVTYLSGRAVNLTQITQKMTYNVNNQTKKVKFTSSKSVYSGRTKPLPANNGDIILVIQKNLTGTNDLNLSKSDAPVAVSNLTGYTLDIVDPDPIVKWSVATSPTPAQAPSTNSGGGGGGSNPAPTVEPVAEPVVEPIVEPITEPFVEPTVEPKVETIPEKAPVQKSIEKKKTIAEKKVTEGDKVALEVAGESHSVAIDEITDDYVKMTIRSEPITLKINKGETKTVDCTGDNRDDLEVTVKDIIDGEADIVINEIIQVQETQQNKEEGNLITGNVVGGAGSGISKTVGVLTVIFILLLGLGGYYLMKK